MPPGTEVVNTVSERQVRSYHRAFTGELVLYTLGGDLRPWRPIPARGVFWAVAIELIAFVLAHLLGLSLPFGPSWGLYYLVIPFGFAWLFTVTRVEGRRLHVSLIAWMRHITLGNHLVGGYRRLPQCKSLHLSQTRSFLRVRTSHRINVRPIYVPPQPSPARRYVTATLPLLLSLVMFWFAFNSHEASVKIEPTSAPVQPVVLSNLVMSILRIAPQPPTIVMQYKRHG